MTPHDPIKIPNALTAPPYAAFQHEYMPKDFDALAKFFVPDAKIAIEFVDGRRMVCLIEQCLTLGLLGKNVLEDSSVFIPWSAIRLATLLLTPSDQP
jgi:hypothetical protein